MGEANPTAEARAIATDLSKFLKFTYALRPKWDTITDPKLVRKYLDHIRSTGASGVEGILTKIQRIMVAGASTSRGESSSTIFPYRGRGLCPYSSSSESSEEDDGPDPHSLMDGRINLLGSGMEDTPPMKEEDSPIKRKRPRKRPRKPTISSDSDREELEVSQCFVAMIIPNIILIAEEPRLQ